MKCANCKFFHCIHPSMEAPNGEYACMKREEDLWGATEKDVEDCPDFEQLGR